MQITQEQKDLILELRETFQAMDLAQLTLDAVNFTVREIETRVLHSRKFEDEDTGEEITDPSLSYTMNDKDFGEFLKARFPLLLEAGIKVEGENTSPTRNHRVLVRDFEIKILRICEKLTGQKLESVGVASERKFIKKARSLVKMVNIETERKEGQ